MKKTRSISIFLSHIFLSGSRNDDQSLQDQSNSCLRLVPCESAQQLGAIIGTVKLAAVVKPSLCRLCPWMNAEASDDAPGLKLITQPMIAPGVWRENFIHPALPAGMRMGILGGVGGKEEEMT